MSRSVVLAGTERCDGCLVPPRWCVCGAVPPVHCPLAVDILIHRREQWRPTSTGKLIERVYEGARTHVFNRELSCESLIPAGDGRQVWILHPRGDLIDPIEARATDPGRIRAIILDGSWAETGRMLSAMAGWGRPVRLLLPGTSRYWLRDQNGEGNVSTVEALLGLLSHLGLEAEEARLRLHFELQVYVSLRSRGRLEAAETYLRDSPIRTALPDLLAKLHQRRPNPG